jgi:hypothetical protein
MSWRVAKSLIKLRDQIDAAYPHRSKASDGTIGDAAHRAEGKASDHNPWVTDSAGVGVVRALDITHDPAHGCDTYALADRLRTSKDHRLNGGGYIISNRRITGPNHDWRWVAYSGSDPHTNHMHVSVSLDQGLYDSAAAWVGVTEWKLPPYPGRVLRVLSPMMAGLDVRQWQRAAQLLGYWTDDDGVYGPASGAACRKLQAGLHVPVDGMVGPVTWAATRAAVAKL